METLRDAAAAHDVADRAMIVNGDGMDTAWTKLSEYDSAIRILVHIDPFDPFEMSPIHRLTPLDLARRVSERGANVFYWYGFDEPSQAGWAFDEIATGFQGPTWYGEVSVDPSGPKMLQEGILLGCGIVCTNLQESTTNHLADLGHALERIYAAARLPDGSPGALRFTSGSNS